MKPRKALSNSVQAYYQTLKDFEFQRAFHEGAVSVAFQTLLSDAGRPHGWTLIPQLSDKRAGGGIRPDGTLKDQMNLVRGHWEAKDTDDNLDVEIIKKSRKGYPLGNIIFEDTRNAVLLQNKTEVMRVDLKDPERLVALLDQFFGYVEPQIEGFENAVNEFKDRVPELAKALKDKVIDAHLGNRPFKEAFSRFFELCKSSLNPNIAKEAVDDMLVQHLLTERLIREIFDNPEFTRRNVIATEIEKVIEALTSRAFNRDVFLKSLDRFYIAIENAARTITDWSDKQHFLNTIYERFFQGYSVKLADTMGIVYTPQTIVDFMCASVAEVLEKEFGKTLGSKDVNILDPCTGTGNFIVNLMKRIPKRDLPRVYKEQLFANEIMLLPYYIAAMNIEHAYYELTGEYESFEGLCFVDTLDLADSHAPQFSFMTAKNTERVERQKRTPITVIIGNPPYNAAQENENDNNKNRKYPTIDERIRETYVRDSTATLKAQLYDPFVKFFRWSSDRLGNRPGVVCLVTNNAFVSKLAFSGMRKHLRADFAALYHLDLHGDVRENPKLSGTTHNVFGIQVGVGITIAVRDPTRSTHDVHYLRVPGDWRKEQKLQMLAQAGDLRGVAWASMPDNPHSRWIVLEHSEEFDTFTPLGTKEAKRVLGDDASGVLFSTYSGGVKSNRDDVVYDFHEDRLADRLRVFIERYNAEVDRCKRAAKPIDVDAFVNYAAIQWDGTLKKHLVDHRYAEFTSTALRRAMFRPFTQMYLYFDRLLNNSVYLQRYFFPNQASERENIAINVTYDPQIEFSALLVNCIPCLHLGGRQGQCFPLYVYDEHGGNRRDNITDWALNRFRAQYADNSITKLEIFYYIYGLLHHPSYRKKFAANLRREMPRIPFAQDFCTIHIAGRDLAELHLKYCKLEPWHLVWTETVGVPLSYRVEKMKLAKEKTTLIVNPSLSLGQIPSETFEYRIGNRSALEWVIDQYQIVIDARSGVASDPNDDADPELIVRLVGQIIRLSVETMKIVKSLPDLYGALSE